MKRARTKWPQIRRKVERYSAKELIDLLKALYETSDEAKLFLEARLGKSEASLKTHLTKLKRALAADPIYGDEIDWSEADKVVNNYRIAARDDEGLAELLVTCVEVGNQFTLDYGDIDEGYYDTMEKCFQDAANHLVAMEQEGKNIDPYRTRLEKVVESTNGIGWGYHDALVDIHYRTFPDE